jgi:hypothetical protein
MICVNKFSHMRILTCLQLVILVLCTVIVRSVAWLVGWALILEYTIGGAAVARGISPNLVH